MFFVFFLLSHFLNLKQKNDTGKMNTTFETECNFLEKNKKNRKHKSQTTFSEHSLGAVKTTPYKKPKTKISAVNVWEYYDEEND